MSIKFYLLTACLGWNGSLAWAQNDHLIPSRGYFSSYAHENSYYPRVREVLCEGLSVTPLAQVVVLPSLMTEYLLALEREKQHFYLVYRSCQPSVWSTMRQNWTEPQPKTGKQPTVKTERLEVSVELATAIGALLNEAIAQTRYPAPTMTQTDHFDGTTFIFSNSRTGIGLQGGQMWSPPVGTQMSALEAVVNRLQQLALATDADRASLAASVTEQAIKLTKQLQTP